MIKPAMVIDLNRCVRSRTCYIACKQEHHIAGQPRDGQHPYEHYRLRYVEWEWGKYPAVRRAYLPVPCMHCGEPACMDFCPLDAISKRSDGIVIIDKERCNGCGVCARACPYGALYITPEGKADGCDFCADRLDAGLAPRCAAECPSKAVLFGDLDDPTSEIQKYLAAGKARPLLLGGMTDTRVYYSLSANEAGWSEVPDNKGFLSALEKRRRDLPPIKKAGKKRT